MLHAAETDWGKLVVLAGGAVLAATGAAGLAGSALPGWPLSAGSAFGFALCGGCAVARGLRRLRLARTLSASVTVWGALGLLAYLFPSAFTAEAATPLFGNAGLAEMGPLPSLAFVLAGSALAFSSRTRNPLKDGAPVAVLATALLALALIALFGAASGSLFVQHWLQLRGDETLAASAFLLLGACLLGYAATRVDASELRRWAPLPVWLVVFLGSLILWEALNAQQARQIDRSVTWSAGSIARHVAREVDDRLRALRRIAVRWSVAPPTRAEWEAEAQQLTRDFPDLERLDWADVAYIIRWSVPAAGAEGIMGSSLLDEEPYRHAAIQAVRGRDEVLTPGSDVITGHGERALVLVPVYSGERFDGLVMGTLRMQRLLASLVEATYPQFAVQLFEEDRKVASVRESEAAFEGEPVAESRIALRNERWTVRVAPTRRVLAEANSSLPEGALAAGVLLATLLAASVHYFQLARSRASEAETANRRLSQEMQGHARAAADLRSSEERLGGMLEMAQDAVISVDCAQRIILFNRGAQKTFGYTPQEMLGRPLAMLLPEQLPGGHPTSLEALTHPAAAASVMEIWARRKDGSEFPAEASVSRFIAGGDTVLTLMLRDVTERRQWEERLLASRAFYFKLFSDFPNLVWRTDQDGRREYFNQAWLEFTGHPLDHELGDGWLEGVHPDDVAGVNASLYRAISARQPFQLEYRLCRHTGQYGWLVDVGKPFYDMDGRYGGYLGTCHDITSRRLVEIALRESEERYETMTSNVPGMVFRLVRAAHGRIAFDYVSRGAEGLTGLKRGALLTSAEAFLQLLPGGERARFEDSLAEAAANFAPWEWSGRIEFSQDTRWVSLRASPSRLDESRILWDGIMLDDTRSVLAQYEIERSREQLRSLSQHMESIREEEKARISREIHDELGGTLTAVKMDVFWLGARLDAAPLQEKIGDIEAMLDAAVAATRRIATELRPTIIDDLGLVPALRWQAQEFQKRVGIACTLEVRARHVSLDNQRSIAFFRIFQETLTNVARHANARRVWVTFEERGDFYVLRVTDDGVGMRPEQLYDATAHGVRGMEERARQFNGQVTLGGEPGKGTVITASIRKH